MGVWDWLRPRRQTDETTISPAVFAVIDVETTGLAAACDRVLELSVIRCDGTGRALDEWSSRFNPQGPVGATHIHGITAADVADAPLFASAVPVLAGRLSGLVLVAHNARFDLAFLRAEFARAGWSMPGAPALCTLEESRTYLPSLSRRRLPDCCAAVGVRHEAAHSALGDARATAALLATYLSARGSGAGPYSHLVAEAGRVRWPEGPSGRVLAAPPAPVVREVRRIREQPREHRRLVELLDDLAISDVIPGDAPEGTASYLELLAEVLEDGVLTEDEAGALVDVAQLWELPSEAVSRAHEAFLLALADKAVADARVSQTERAELYAVADLLGVDGRGVLAAIDAAVARRDAHRSEGLEPLPEDWAHGEPLRVGQSVVFTGCEEDTRTALERRAKDVGVRVAGNVSGSTVMLVTDGSFAGTKLEAAQRRGMRIVDPEVFSILLDHLQPARVRTATTVKHGRAAQAGSAAVAISPAVIREWARSRGIEVGDRGRLPLDVVTRYREEHPAEVAP